MTGTLSIIESGGGTSAVHEAGTTVALLAQLTAPSMWDTLSGAPVITISPVGTATAGIVLPNNGADYGPDTASTTTQGWQEASNFAATVGASLMGLVGAFSFAAPVNVNGTTYAISIGAEAGATFTGAVAFTGTPLAQFSGAALFNVSGSVCVQGLNEVVGSQTALLSLNVGGQYSVQRNTVVSQIQVEVASGTLSPTSFAIRDNVFNRGAVLMSTTGTVRPNISDKGVIVSNVWNSFTMLTPAIGSVGSNAPAILSDIVISDNVMSDTSRTSTIPANFVYFDMTMGGENSRFSNNNIDIQPATAGTGWGVFRNTVTEYYPFVVSGNHIKAWCNVSSTILPILIHLTSAGNVSQYLIEGNTMLAYVAASGTAGSGYGVLCDYSGAGTINEVRIINNSINAQVLNAFRILENSTATPTVGHTVQIQGNYIQRAAQDAISIEPNGGQMSDFVITDNIMTDYNWMSSASPVYAAIAIDRAATSGSKVWEGCLIANNLFSSTDKVASGAPGTIQTGVFTSTTVSFPTVTSRAAGQGLDIHDNHCIAVSQDGGGTTAQPYSINGNTVLPGGSFTVTVPASGTEFANPIAMKAAAVITGGTVTIIAINGVTTGLTSGVFEISATDTLTITYSVVPTVTLIIH